MNSKIAVELTLPYFVEFHKGNKISGVGVGVDDVIALDDDVIAVDDDVRVVSVLEDVGATALHIT